MKNLTNLIAITIFLTACSFGQKAETFDIVTFKTPKGWQKEIQKNAVQFGAEDANGGICLITIFKSMPGTNDSKVNFEAAWDSIVKEVVTVKSAPQMNSPGNENGWIVESGAAQYEADGKQGAVILITATGNSKMVNILILTNSDSFQESIEEFVESATLPKIEENFEPQNIINKSNISIIGTWGRGNSVTKPGGSFGRWSYTKQQYTFAENGEYSYIRKNYVEDDKETYLTIETGTYSLNGNSLTLNPKSNVIEAWSKKNGGDNYNQLITRQSQALEKTIYQVTIHFFSELNQSNLVLLANRETVRDGRFNAGNEFPNGWRFSPAPSYTPIKLP